jgi:DNA-binding IclR family transcriptional regulator
MTGKRHWTLISSHGAVLIEVARDPDLPVREIAGRVGLTDRHAYRMLADLCDEGYLVRERVGAKNHYRVDPKRPMRHPALADRQVGELLHALAGTMSAAGSGG